VKKFWIKIEFDFEIQIDLEFNDSREWVWAQAKNLSYDEVTF
jgi:hypothetical protein